MLPFLVAFLLPATRSSFTTSFHPRPSLKLLSSPEVSPSTTISDIAAFCSIPQPKKAAAVYTVFSANDEAQYVGITRDVQGSLAKHLGSQTAQLCASAEYTLFPRPSRADMASLQASLVSFHRNPPGNMDATNAWASPPLSDTEALTTLKIRQASADATLATEDPAAWSQVVKKSMKGGDDCDGSADDMLDLAIADDDRRTSGDWAKEVEGLTKRAKDQFVDIEMYFAPGCPHCDRMRESLKSKGLIFAEYNVEGDAGGLSEDQTRRRRHALFNTVPQLYLVREPPYNGRDSETLVGGADDLEEKSRIPLWDYWIGEYRRQYWGE